MRQDLELDGGWILSVQVPNIGATRLIAHGQNLLPIVHGETNEPDFTVFVVETIDNGDVGFIHAKFFVFKSTWFPADDAVLARLKR